MKPDCVACYLVGVVVADDALVLGEAQLAALISGQSKRGQEARSQSLDRGVVIGNCKDTETMACYNAHTTHLTVCPTNSQNVCEWILFSFTTLQLQLPFYSVGVQVQTGGQLPLYREEVSEADP